MERPEDAPLADESGPVPDDMPLDSDDEGAGMRPHRTEHQTPEPRPEQPDRE